MRLICTITDHTRENPYAFSYYLTSQGIENECEEILSKGVPHEYNIWIYDEDQVAKAQQLYKSYQENPHDPMFKIPPKHLSTPPQEEEPPVNDNQEEDQIATKRTTRRRFLSPAPYGPVSIFVLLIVIALFFVAQMQRGLMTPPKIPGVIEAPLLPPVDKALLYDYPSYFVLRDQLLKIYTPTDIEQQKPPSKEARALIQELWQTPIWMGIYDRFLNHYRNPETPLGYHGPMFEQIKAGEVWRVFTPALLHFDLLHIFFNVLWFILLGNQIEYRLGWWRYSLLILSTAIVSNTAQYLMSGPFFMGLSGVVVGMAAFIWARQQVAPWEGYLLHRLTLIFLAIFVIGMFVLQIVFFVLQILGKFQPSIGIANTAHLAGALVGYLLGRMRLFSIHPK